MEGAGNWAVHRSMMNVPNGASANWSANRPIRLVTLQDDAGERSRNPTQRTKIDPLAEVFRFLSI